MVTDDRLVGRRPELAALRAALSGAVAGRGSLTVVVGEAGVGKTSLARVIAGDAAAAGAHVLTGRCYDVSFTPLYSAWVDLFDDERDAGAVPAAFARRGVLDATTHELRLFQDVREFLTALSRERPVVLVLDDLQWADLASCELLRYLARDVDRQRIMIVATVNEDALDRSRPLHRLLPAIERESGAARIAVPGLRPEDLEELVTRTYRLPGADVARLQAYVHGMTHGNALFATELLRALEEQGILRRDGDGWHLGDLAHVGMPLRLGQVIDGRLVRLREEAHDLLATAAVIGADVPFALWVDVCGGDEEAMLGVLEEAAAAHIVEPTPDGVSFGFVHPLVHEVLYERVFPVRRRLVHRRIAETLAAQPAPDPDTVARHLHNADDDRAGEWLVRAGRRAEDAGALRTAVERYEAALQPLERAGAAPAERAWVLLSLALLRRMDDSWRAVTYVDLAMRLAQECGDPDVSAWVLLGRGIVRCYAGMIEQGLADLGAGVAEVDALPPGRAVGRSRGASVATLLSRGPHAYWLAVSGRLDAALAVAAEHARRAVGSPDDEHEAAAVAGCQWGSAFVHAVQGRVAQARLAYAAAAAAFGKLDQHRLAFVALRDELVYVVLPYRTDDLAERERLVTALRQMADQGTAVRAFVDEIDNVRYPLLQLMVVEGRWDEVHEVVDAMGAYGIPVLRHVVGSVLGPVARAQGDPALAWRLVRETWPAGPASEPGGVEIYHTMTQQRLAVELSLDEGDLIGARAWLETHERWLAWAGLVQGRSEADALWARYELASGRPAAAHRHAEHALAAAGEPRQPLALLAAYRLLGEIETATGHHADAAGRFEAALALAEACGAPYERALVLLAAAEHAVACGAGAEAAVPLLTEVRALAAPLGAEPLLERASALQARLGAEQPDGAFPAGLTPREAEVLGLLARGLSDKEIAAALHLSPRTVGRHVEKAYRKVGAHRRAQAAVFALRHGLVGEDRR